MNSGRIVSVELKPCPFCGGSASIQRIDITQGYEYYVRCDTCKTRNGIQVSSGYDELSIETAKLAVSMAWNVRKEARYK